MRKNNLLTSTALTTSAMLASSAALAQSPPVYNWSGFYIGVNAGGGWAEVEEGLSIPGRLGYQTSVTDSGFTGGVQLGYNWFIAPNWLFGIEGDINYLRGARQDTFRFINTGEDVVGRQETKLRRLSTVRGRLGYVWASTAFYATGGLAIGDVKSDVSATRSDCRSRRSDICRRLFLDPNRLDSGWRHRALFFQQVFAQGRVSSLRSRRLQLQREPGHGDGFAAGRAVTVARQRQGHRRHRAVRCELSVCALNAAAEAADLLRYSASARVRSARTVAAVVNASKG